MFVQNAANFTLENDFEGGIWKVKSRREECARNVRYRKLAKTFPLLKTGKTFADKVCSESLGRDIDNKGIRFIRSLKTFSFNGSVTPW